MHSNCTFIYENCLLLLYCQWLFNCLLYYNLLGNSYKHFIILPFPLQSACNCYDIDIGKLFYSIPDDPYYCGLRARVPNFVKTTKNKGKDSLSAMKRISVSNLQHPAASLASLHQLHQMHAHNQPIYGHHGQYPSHHMMLHTRSFESGIGKHPTHNNQFELTMHWFTN